MTLRPGDNESYAAAMRGMEAFGADGLEEFLEVSLFEEAVAFVGEHVRVTWEGAAWKMVADEAVWTPTIMSSIGPGIDLFDAVACAFEAGHWPLEDPDEDDGWNPPYAEWDAEELE